MRMPVTYTDQSVLPCTQHDSDRGALLEQAHQMQAAPLPAAVTCNEALCAWTKCCMSQPHIFCTGCMCMQVLIAGRLPCNTRTSSAAALAAPLGPANDAICAAPFARWDVEVHHAGRPALGARFGGWLSGVAGFDAVLFGVSAPEAQLMDPQQRLLLEV